MVLHKSRSKRYPAETITDAVYADDIALLANTLTQVESMLQSLNQAAWGIGLHVNADKTEYMCFNQGDISTLNDGSLKLVEKFTHLSSSVSSTESDINMRLAKAWIAISKLLIIWMSNLSDKIKHNFFQVAVVSVLLYGCTTWMRAKRIQKARRELHKNATRYIEQILEATFHKTRVVRPPTS